MNLRKAWHVAQSTRPHAVIFLGDLMDNGFADMHITQYVLYARPSPLYPPLPDPRIQVSTCPLLPSYFGS